MFTWNVLNVGIIGKQGKKHIKEIGIVLNVGIGLELPVLNVGSQKALVLSSAQVVPVNIFLESVLVDLAYLQKMAIISISILMAELNTKWFCVLAIIGLRVEKIMSTNIFLFGKKLMIDYSLRIGLYTI
jgi:hypothetical protein